MGSFRNLSIKWKLKLIIMLTSGIALLFAAGSLLYKDIITSRKTIRDDLSGLARVIGMNSIGAIVFNDQQTAENNLTALHAIPYIVMGCIYDRDRRLFAQYVHENMPEDSPAPEIREPGYYYEGNYLLVFNPVFQEQDIIGTICIKYDMKGIQSKTLRSAAVFGAIVGIAFLIIWVMSSWLQKVVSKPILSLTQVARVVSEKKDFSVRAEKHARDEIGVLIDGFNDMLAAIQSRDEKLQEYREHLEEQVADRTTALREANEMLQAAKEAAESASYAKSEFLANMSHEIRTPMNTVLGFTDLLKSSITDKRQKSYLEAISSSGRGLLTLINGILDLSKIEAGKMELEYEPVNPHTVFDEIRHIFALQAQEKKIEFTVALAPDIPDCLMLDEVRLKQILFNLIGNAVKFTEKGYVRIRVEKRGDLQEAADIGLIITVEDSGIGIPAQYHDAIFEAFKQKDGQSTKRFGGTGLGLSITKRLVEMMGGTIEVHSRENQGSRFLLLLPRVPLAEAPAGAGVDDGFDPERIAFEPASVLVVDDVATNRLLIKEFLRSTQLTIIEAENGEDAVHLAKEHLPAVVLMDLRMPVLDGVAAMKRIRADDDTRSIPVIVLTASGMKEDQARIMQEGFSGYLTKPIKKATLFQELSRLIAHTEIEPGEGDAPAAAMGMVSPRLVCKVVGLLEGEYMQKWKEIRKNLFFDEIGEFGHRIRELGAAYTITDLNTYGEELSGHAESFDVEKMNTTLNAYPDIIAAVKSLCVDIK
jgi:signal transduction histidine kinase/ActR/RegA family two-component response regulator